MVQTEVQKLKCHLEDRMRILHRQRCHQHIFHGARFFQRLPRPGCMDEVLVENHGNPHDLPDNAMNIYIYT